MRVCVARVLFAGISEFICSKRSPPLNVLLLLLYRGLFICKSQILSFLSLDNCIAFERFYIGLALVGFYRMWDACLFSINISSSPVQEEVAKVAHRSRIEDQGSKGTYKLTRCGLCEWFNFCFYLAMHVMNVLNVRMCMINNMHDNLKF